MRARQAPGNVGASDERLVVLQSFPARGQSTNPYLTQLFSSLSNLVDVQHFSWRQALTGRFDVFHVHWPEVTARGRTPARALARRLLFLLVLLRIRFGRRALVRTLHNVAPHELGPLSERAVLRLCDRWTTMWIKLSPLTVSPSSAPAVVVRHGHYRDWFAGQPVPRSINGRLLFFGLIRKYKGVTELLDALLLAPQAEVTLRLVGSTTEADLADAIGRASDTDHRITAILDYVADDVLARELGEAELVVLPHREMHNSGSALLALSLGRPILVPASPINAALSDEVGPGWVYTFDGPLTIESIEGALLDSRGSRSRAPNLALREWNQIASEHLAIYRLATYLAADR